MLADVRCGCSAKGALKRCSRLPAGRVGGTHTRRLIVRPERASWDERTHD
jgi:hypothetical protein